MSKGLFIAIEGIGGSGKSTFRTYLAEQFRARGFDVIETREPGGTPKAEILRELCRGNWPHYDKDDPLDPLASVMLFNAARVEHVNKVVIPSLEAGKIVICDRYLDSTLAYQSVIEGVDIQLMNEIHGRVVGLYPHLTFLLNCDTNVAASRLSNEEKATDRFDNAHTVQQEAIRRTYVQLALQAPKRYMTLDANHSKEDVIAQIEGDYQVLDEIVGCIEVAKAFGGSAGDYLSCMYFTDARRWNSNDNSNTYFHGIIKDHINKDINALAVDVWKNFALESGPLSVQEIQKLASKLNSMTADGTFIDKYVAMKEEERKNGGE